MKFFFIVLVSFSLFLSCGTRGAVNPRVAVVLGPANNAWYIRLRQVIDQATMQHPEISWTIRNARNTDEQLSMLRSFKDEQFDAVIIMPLDSFRIVPIAEDMLNSGIHTIILNRRLATTNYTALITGDNYGGGVVAARLLGERLGGVGNIAVLRSSIGSTMDVDRFNGFFGTLQSDFPDMRIIGQGDGGLSRETGWSAMNTLLEEHSNIFAVFAQDDEAALGAMFAINNSGRNDIMYMTGFGGSRAILDYLLDDTSIFYASMSHSPAIGATAVEMAVLILEGIPVPRDTLISSRVIGNWNIRDHWEFAY